MNSHLKHLSVAGTAIAAAIERATQMPLLCQSGSSSKLSPEKIPAVHEGIVRRSPDRRKWQFLYFNAAYGLCCPRREVSRKSRSALKCVENGSRPPPAAVARKLLRKGHDQTLSPCSCFTGSGGEFCVEAR
jgi:hypothetical protein